MGSKPRSKPRLRAPMTEELRNLRAAYGLKGVLHALDFDWIDTPYWDEPSKPEVTAKELERPSIACDVFSIKATNELIGWFGVERRGAVGLWFGEEDTPPESAPIVLLSRRAEYSILAATLGDYVIAYSDEPFESYRPYVVGAGLKVSETMADLRAAIEKCSDPAAYRHRIENEQRKLHGLKPLKPPKKKTLEQLISESRVD